ncbi:Sarcosine oxidase gamma subunit [Roseibacterium elongatum DSM 19469]|uniref:Sarcosine oxidase gamma subunit n=2 Tax=Roseicyclus elongatus TaxID=159346 RepID=W8S4L5_9RHOB|nr:Sarcosine oxidase gamma subunit [Roseibacterium elongatum DSM 19469]
MPGADAQGLVTIREAGLVGMVTFRGDLSAAATKKAVKSATGCDMPERRGVVTAGDNGVAWMSPDELLVICPHDLAERVAADLSEAMGEAHNLALNVSDVRAVFEVTGPAWRDVLAKVTPADLSRDVFGPGEMRRTRMAQVAAAVWMTGDDTVRVICFRSVARYMFDLLALSAQEGGAVGYH